MSIQIDLRTVQLLCSRLCHDLVGPIGAVGNGVELMQELGAGDAETIGLVADSAMQAGVRLRFFRVAYGLSPGTVRTAGDARALFEPLFREGRVRVETRVPDGTSLAGDMPGKVLLNAVAMVPETLPRGGTIVVEADGSALRITTEGEGASIPEQSRAALADEVPVDALTPRSVQAWLTARLAVAAGGALLWEERPGRVSFATSFPVFEP